MIRIGLLMSILLNAILVMVVLGVLPFLLYISVFVNLILIWFSMTLASRTVEFEEDIIDLLESTSRLQKHIESIHEMEMFYGDETLQGLMDHTRDIVGEIDFYRLKYSEEDEGDEEDMDIELDMEVDEEELDAPPTE